jgi:hypothetical protein
MGSTTILRKGNVKEGDHVIRYKGLKRDSFLCLLRNASSRLSLKTFREGELWVESRDHNKVFSMTAGYLYVHPPLDEADSNRIVSVSDGSLEVIYMGIADAPGNAEVGIGSQIGILGKVLSRYVAGFKVYRYGQKGELSPNVIYIEFSKGQESPTSSSLSIMKSIQAGSSLGCFNITTPTGRSQPIARVLRGFLRSMRITCEAP